MEIGIALDGEGALGRPAAVTTLARAADRLGYRSVWCSGPWGPTLVGAVAAVTSQVRIGFETGAARTADLNALRAVAGDRLVLVERLPTWPPGTAGVDDAGAPPATAYRLDVAVDATIDTIDTMIVGATPHLVRAGALGIRELVIALRGDPDLDTALAAFAQLAEVAYGVTVRAV